MTKQEIPFTLSNKNSFRYHEIGKSYIKCFLIVFNLTIELVSQIT